jgi:hypothetical protein
VRAPGPQDLPLLEEGPVGPQAPPLVLDEEAPSKLKT